MAHTPSITSLLAPLAAETKSRRSVVGWPLTRWWQLSRSGSCVDAWAMMSLHKQSAEREKNSAVERARQRCSVRSRSFGQARGSDAPHLAVLSAVARADTWRCSNHSALIAHRAGVWFAGKLPTAQLQTAVCSVRIPSPERAHSITCRLVLHAGCSDCKPSTAQPGFHVCHGHSLCTHTPHTFSSAVVPGRCHQTGLLLGLIQGWP